MYTKIRMISGDHLLVGLVKCLMDANACSDTNVMLTGIEECIIHIDQTFVESVDRERGKHGLADVVTLDEDVGQGTFHKIHV